MFHKVLLVLVLTLSVPTFAAKNHGTATFNVDSEGVDNGTMTFEYLDRETSRMSFSSQGAAQGYILVRDNTAWLVSNAQGQTFAMDLAKTRDLAQTMGANPDQMQNEVFGNRVHKMKRTGDTETIAKFKGDVYEIEIEEDGKKRKDTLVLTDDPAVVAYTRAWMAAFETMRKATAPDYQPHKNDFVRKLEDEDRGILRMGQEFRLASLSSKAPRQARFDVPKSTFDPSTLGGLLSGVSGSANTPADTPADSATGDEPAAPEERTSAWGKLGSVFTRKSKEQVDRKEAEADQAVDRAVDRTVDDATDSAVDKVLDSIFN